MGLSDVNGYDRGDQQALGNQSLRDGLFSLDVGEPNYRSRLLEYGKANRAVLTDPNGPVEFRCLVDADFQKVVKTDTILGVRCGEQRSVFPRRIHGLETTAARSSRQRSVLRGTGAVDCAGHARSGAPRLGGSREWRDLLSKHCGSCQ